MNNVVIDFSAFKRSTLGGNLQSLLKAAFVSLIAITAFFIILWVIEFSFLRLGVELNNTLKTIIDMVKVLVLVASLFYIAYKFDSKGKRNHTKIFQDFAEANDFNFRDRLKEVPPSSLFGDLTSYVSEGVDTVTGRYADRMFRLYTFSKTSLAGEGGATAYYGVLEVQLRKSYPTFIINNSINNHPFITQELIATTKAMNGSKVELIDDIIYFVTDDGMDMTPEGMAKIFQLIELASQLDT